MSANGIPHLWHLKVSHYNEKARWALDYKRVPHLRTGVMPGVHAAIAVMLTGRSITFPILALDGEVIGDSTEIIAALEQRHPDPPLYPADDGDRRRALDLEEFFDTQLGPDVRRIGFWELVRSPETLRAAGFPPVGASTMLRRRFAISRRRTAVSRLKVRAALRLIEDELDGGDHLVAGRFTVADLTAAALLAPLITPPQLPYRSADDALSPALERLHEEVRETAAGQWVLRMYERHRPTPAGTPL